MIAFGVGLLLGALAGVVVTRRLHRIPDDPMSGGWGSRIGRTRFRWANWPVGGFFAVAFALTAPAGDVRALVLGAGAGMTVTAIGWRYVDPLPPASVRTRRAPP